MSKGKPRLPESERRRDCIWYGDCLMNAALCDARNFTCYGCSLYEKDVGWCNNRPPQRVYVHADFFSASYSQDINWLVRKSLLSRQQQLEM